MLKPKVSTLSWSSMFFPNPLCWSIEQTTQYVSLHCFYPLLCHLLSAFSFLASFLFLSALRQPSSPSTSSPPSPFSLLLTVLISLLLSGSCHMLEETEQNTTAQLDSLLLCVCLSLCVCACVCVYSHMTKNYKKEIIQPGVWRGAAV